MTTTSPTSTGRRPAARWFALAAVLASALVVTALAGGASASTRSKSPRSGGTVNLVAYSTPETAYTALISAFKKTAAGKDVTVKTSFGPSGQQATAVVNGLPADVVNFATAPDMTKVVKAGLVSSSWDTAGPQHGMVTDSVVAIVVHKGNPLHITTWGDLLKKDVKLVTPNPFSSGSARWNLLAGYAAEEKLGDDSKQATAYLSEILHRTVAQPASASDAMAAFTEGTGNVLLDYESDAIAAEHSGEQISYVVPTRDLLIQNPIAILKKSESNKAAKAFFDFLLSKKGQEIWAKQGYYPVVSGAAKAARVTFVWPKKVFSIDYLGGWNKVTPEFFGKNGIVTKIEESLGVGTSS